MNIEIVELKSDLALAYKEHSTMENMSEVMGRGLNAIYSRLKELGKQAIGAPYAAYLNANETEDFAEFDLELGFPVAEEIPATENLYMSKTYGGKAVTATHKGPYSTLETTYCAVMDFIKENGSEHSSV